MLADHRTLKDAVAANTEAVVVCSRTIESLVRLAQTQSQEIDELRRRLDAKPFWWRWFAGATPPTETP